MQALDIFRRQVCPLSIIHFFALLTENTNTPTHIVSNNTAAKMISSMVPNPNIIACFPYEGRRPVDSDWLTQAVASFNSISRYLESSPPATGGRSWCEFFLVQPIGQPLRPPIGMPGDARDGSRRTMVAMREFTAPTRAECPRARVASLSSPV
jgi:hypothetical protein